MKTVTLFEKSEKSGYLILAIPSLWWRKRGLFASLTKTGQRQIIVWVEYLQKKLIPKAGLRNGNYVVHVGNEWRRLWMICRSIEAPTPLVLPEGLQCSLLGRTEYNEHESFSCFYFQQFAKVLKPVYLQTRGWFRYSSVVLILLSFIHQRRTLRRCVITQDAAQMKKMKPQILSLKWIKQGTVEKMINSFQSRIAEKSCRRKWQSVEQTSSTLRSLTCGEQYAVTH